ncbi:MAG: hypothetical protein LBH76_04205 [Propionibacteriaceae bacterium]|nr:hypothetical protein [Propionibacteriaceae bacterium]
MFEAGPAELGRRGLDLLLPFSLLRLRARARAASPAGRARLAPELERLTSELVEAVEAGRLAGRLDSDDAEGVLEAADALSKVLYRDRYVELREVDEMATLLKTRSQVAREEGREEGREELRRQGVLRAVAKGLSWEQIAVIFDITADDIAGIVGGSATASQ